MKRFSEPFIGGLIFIVTLLIFWFSPVHQISDSRYSMLLSQCLLDYRSFALDNYRLPRLEPAFARDDYVMIGDIYQLELKRDRIYYFFPPGSSILSLPAVALANALGISAANPDGTYNHLGEIRIETTLAAILMAGLASVFFLTSRLLLPIGWSVLIALGGALGTQVWSTASRALWSHTWGIFLLGIIIYLLLAAETGRRCPRPVLLASLLAWTYFVRPSNSIFVIAISVYVFLYYRKSFIPYAFTGAVWLTGFIIYSWHNFGQLLPSYYRANRLRFDAFHVALPGNLISPGRGLLVYVPVLLFIVYLLARYWSERPCPRLVWLALAVVTLNVLAISAFPHWWGGASFGPRLSTETVPWLVLLGIISVKTWMNGREKQRAASSSFRRRAEILAGVSLLALSVFINARGALSFDTWKWNEHPQQVELVQKKLWDWRQPPFLAGIVRPPLDREYPLIETTTRIEFGKKEAGRYLWYGWSSPEETLRWSESKEAALVFALKEIKDVNLRIRLAPFIAKNVHDRQRLTIRLNGQPVHFQVFNDSRDYQVAVMLSRSLLRPQNVVVFELPDAATPASYNLSIDERPLGIAVKWAELEPLDQ